MTAKSVAHSSLDLAKLKKQYASYGVTTLFVKYLAPNDNNKNQPYLARKGQNGLRILQMFPTVDLVADQQPGGRTNLKGKLRFCWLDEEGQLYPAAGTQIILYPKYPEVRLSGFLRGCEKSPSLMATREPGRVLTLGVTGTGTTIGAVFSGSSTVAAQIRAAQLPDAGVGTFLKLEIVADTRQQLMTRLADVHRKGWIRSKSLTPTGEVVSCESSQCVGYTLEAELGVRRNGISEPDFLGWEIKSHGSDKTTLMDLAPDGGLYNEVGCDEFVRRFGYPDTKGREDRLNFGGLFAADRRNSSRALTLKVTGYDDDTGAVDVDGKIKLVSDHGQTAAAWSFPHLMRIWTRKHNKAAHVEAKGRVEPTRQYTYGPLVGLGEGTDFGRFLHAVVCGGVYFDPAMKVEKVSNLKSKSHARCLFRTAVKNISQLYTAYDVVDVRGV